MLDETRRSATELRELWQALLPVVEAPNESQFLIWANLYRRKIRNRGVTRVAAKAAAMHSAGGEMNTLDAIRYASSVMLKEHQALESFNQRRATFQAVA